MGESIRKSIERWETIAKTTNAASILPEIETYFHKISDNEDLKSNVSRKVYGVLMKCVTHENAANLVEIFKFLRSQAPNYIFSYFLAVLFNKTLELEKEKNFKLGLRIAEAFIIDLSLTFEIKPENIDLTMTIIQQWIFFHYKGGLPATPTLNSIVVENLKIVLPYTDSKKYIMILDKFLGASPNLAPALGSLQNGGSILKEVLRLVLSHSITLDELTKQTITNNLPKYVLTALNVASIDPESFKSYEYEILKQLKRKIPNSVILNFLLVFSRLNEEPTIANLNSIGSILATGLTESKTLAVTPGMIDSCFIVAKYLKNIVTTLNPYFECDSLLFLLKFIMNLIKVLINCDSEVDRRYCAECTNTKRHVTDALICISVLAFESFGQKTEVSTELVAYITENIAYKLTTADGLKCSIKDAMIENTVVKIFCLLTHEKMLANTKFTKYKIRLVELCKKYAKNRALKKFTSKHMAHMYSKVYTMSEHPSKHLLINTLQILYESDHNIKTSRTDQVVKKRETVPEYTDFSVLQLLEKAKEEGFELEVPKYDARDIILLEMESIFKYSRSYERNVRLFEDLCELTSDVVVLGHALFLFEQEEHNKVDGKILEQIETGLRKLQPKTMKSEVALGLIVLRKYVNMVNSTRELLKDTKFFQSSNGNSNQIETTNNNFEMLQIKSEQAPLKLLNDSLGHFQMALSIASRDKYKPLDELYSCVKIRRAIDNLALKYEQRGLHFRAMEAQYLSFTIAKEKDDELGLIIGLTHFIENLEQFKKLSKRQPSIPKITQDLNDLLEKFMKEMSSLSLHKQGYVYSAYLSLVSYYFLEESYAEGIKILKLLNDPLHNCEEKKYQSYFQILRFKFYFLHQKLLCEYPTASSVSPIAFLFLIMNELNDLVEYRDEFHVYMPNLLFKIVEYLAWHQLSRYDSKMLESYVILAFKIAARKGMETRCLQIYLMLTYMDLIGENLNDVETHLSRMDRMLGYEPTKITKKPLVQETPGKKPSTSVWTDSTDFHLNTVIGSAVRREPRKSPLPYIMSPPIDLPISDFSKYMIQHEWKCKCIHCGLPQIKVYAFVLGCFYARMLYLNENYGMAYQFYQKAVDYWRTLKECVIASIDQTLIKNFVYYSLYIHLHMCHCVMQMKKFDELEHLCESFKELLQFNVCDNTAIVEECNFTVKIAMEHVSQQSRIIRKFPSFESFTLDEDVQLQLSPPLPKKIDAKCFTTAKKSTKHIPIFIDGQTSAKMSPAQKKRLLFSKKKDTLDSPNVSDLCMDLTSITKSTKKPAQLKKCATEIPTKTKSRTATTVVVIKSVRQSARKANKENESKPTPTPVKRTVNKSTKKQLKFSPPANSPTQDIIILDDTINETNATETPKSSTGRKKAVKPKTVTKSTRVVKEPVTILVDSDSETSVINATIPTPTCHQLRRERAKRYATPRNK